MTDLEHQDSFNFYSVPNGRMPPHLDGGAPPESEFHTSTPELSPASDTGSTVTTTGLTRSLSTSSKSKESTVHQTQQRINIATTNPSHLFWVPASQHPEIAPGEFEEFLRTNALSMQKRSSLKRRSSILSVSFTPGDAEEEENGDTEQGEQRKDALDALERGRSDNEEEQAEGGKKDRRRVRRSLSLNMASEAADQQIPDFLVFDRNSSPLDESRVLVPRADRTSLSRRGARTKFHRNSSFNSRKRVQEQDQNIRPSSFSGPVTLTDAPLQQDVPEIRETAEPGEQVHELAVAKAEQERPPPTPTLTPTPSPTPPPPPPPEQYNQIESEPPRIEPQRKSSWSWGFKKSSSKSEQQKSSLSVPEATPQPRSSRSSETPKKFGLSSLFSRKKSPSPEPVSTVTTTPPKDFQLNRINNNRLPLHIERAIYRLSHAKLANPRRPLHEQVLISNFMFWYLSIVSSSPQHQQRQHNSHSHENPRKMVKKGKRPPAPPKSNKHSPQHHPQKPSDAASYQKYMGASTGFVIPENYLRPNKNPPTSPTPPTPPVVKTNAKRNQRRPSYYDSDEDDDDAESTDSSSEDESPSNTRSKDDNLPLSIYTKKK